MMFPKSAIWTMLACAFCSVVVVVRGQVSDEFDDQTAFDGLWSDTGGPFLVASADVSGGTLTLSHDAAPTFGWYANDEGILLSQSVPAGQNFVVEASLSVHASSGAGTLGGFWHSAGLLVRASPPSPPQTFAMVNVGRQGSAFGLPVTEGTQAMYTDAGSSAFRYEASPGGVLSGRIRICRVGSDVSLLRLLDSDDPIAVGWHALEYAAGGVGVPSFAASADLAGDVDVGIMMSRWQGTADGVEALFDYVRFAEPSAVNDCFVDDISTLTPATSAPVTSAPMTSAPITSSPVTSSPVTAPPATSAPVTSAPATTAPVSSAPITSAPVTSSPVTAPPVTQAPATSPPVTSPPAAAPAIVESLSDEFFDSSTLSSDWTDVGGTPARYVSAEISDGVLSVVPAGPFQANVWYDAFHGTGFTKPVPAGTDFVVETLVNVRVGDDDLPSGNWHVGGIVARSAAQHDDWVCANLGLQGPNPQRMGIPQSLAVETKTTDDGLSHFNYSPDLRLEPSPPTGSTFSARLRICRVGPEFLMMYMLQGQGAWTVQNPLPSHAPWNGVDGVSTSRPDLMGELNVGIMVNHMMDGDPGSDPITVRFDYVRFGSVTSLDGCTGGISVL